MRIALRAMETTSPTDRAKALEIELGEGQGFTIGRTEGDLILADQGISRRHLRLVVRKRALLAEDLNSRNGTYYRGNRITTVPIGETDILRIGQHVLVVDKIFSETPAAVPARKAATKTAPKTAPSNSGFTFLKGNRPDSNLALAFFRNAYTNWRTFWTETSFGGIPPERSLIVLAGIGAASGLLRALIGMILAPSAGGLSVLVPSVVLSSIMMVAGGALAAVVHHYLRGFFRASGELTSYLGFFTYAAALGLPVFTAAALLGHGVGGVVTLVFSGWIGWGFCRAYRANVVRVALTWAGLTVVLGVLAAGMLFSVLRF